MTDPNVPLADAEAQVNPESTEQVADANKRAFFQQMHDQPGFFHGQVPEEYRPPKPKFQHEGVEPRPEDAPTIGPDLPDADPQDKDRLRDSLNLQMAAGRLIPPPLEKINPNQLSRYDRYTIEALGGGMQGLVNWHGTRMMAGRNFLSGIPVDKWTDESKARFKAYQDAEQAAVDQITEDNTDSYAEHVGWTASKLGSTIVDSFLNMGRTLDAVWREYYKLMGVTPNQLGKTSWEDVNPTAEAFGVPYNQWRSPQEVEAAIHAHAKAMTSDGEMGDIYSTIYRDTLEDIVRYEDRAPLPARLARGGGEMVGHVLATIGTGGRSALGRMTAIQGRAMHGFGNAISRRILAHPKLANLAQIPMYREMAQIAGTSISWGAFEAMRNNINPETGELADGWERAKAGAMGLLSWPSFIGIGDLAGRVAGKLDRRMMTQEASKWAEGRLWQTADETAEAFAKRRMSEWMFAGMPRSGGKDGFVKMLMDEGGRAASVAALESVGFSTLDAHWLADVTKAASGDWDAAERAVEKLATNFVGVLMLRGPGTASRILEWQQSHNIAPPRQGPGQGLRWPESGNANDAMPNPNVEPVPSSVPALIKDTPQPYQTRHQKAATAALDRAHGNQEGQSSRVIELPGKSDGPTTEIDAVTGQHYKVIEAATPLHGLGIYFKPGSQGVMRSNGPSSHYIEVKPVRTAAGEAKRMGEQKRGEQSEEPVDEVKLKASAPVKAELKARGLTEDLAGIERLEISDRVRSATALPGDQLLIDGTRTYTRNGKLMETRVAAGRVYEREAGTNNAWEKVGRVHEDGKMIPDGDYQPTITAKKRPSSEQLESVEAISRLLAAQELEPADRALAGEAVRLLAARSREVDPGIDAAIQSFETNYLPWALESATTPQSRGAVVRELAKLAARVQNPMHTESNIIGELQLNEARRQQQEFQNQRDAEMAKRQKELEIEAEAERQVELEAQAKAQKKKAPSVREPKAEAEAEEKPEPKKRQTNPNDPGSIRREAREALEAGNKDLADALTREAESLEKSGVQPKENPYTPQQAYDEAIPDVNFDKVKGRDLDAYGNLVDVKRPKKGGVKKFRELLKDAWDEYVQNSQKMGFIPGQPKVDLGPIKEAVKGFLRDKGKSAVDLLKSGPKAFAKKAEDFVIGNMFRPYLNRIRRAGPEGEFYADQGEMAMDYAKESAGRMGGPFHEILNKTRRPTAAHRELMEIDWHDAPEGFQFAKRWGYSRLQLAMEGKKLADGRDAFESLSPEAREIVGLFRNLHKLAIKEMHDAGGMIELKDGSKVPIADDNVARFPRMRSPEIREAIDQMRHDPAYSDPFVEAMIESIAMADGITMEGARGKVLGGKPGNSTAEINPATRKSHYETARGITNMPVVVETAGGKRRTLVEYEPFSLATEIRRRTSLRAGAIKHLPDAQVGRWIGRLRQKGWGNNADTLATEFTRMMNGLGKTKPYSKPGTLGWQMTRLFDLYESGKSALQLGMAPLVNITEQIGSNVPEVGLGNATYGQLKVLEGIYNSIARSTGRKLRGEQKTLDDLRTELDMEGAATRELHRFVSDPTRKLESWSQIIKILAGHNTMVNEMNGLAAALGARRMVERAQQGKGGEVSRLDTLNALKKSKRFNADEIQQVRDFLNDPQADPSSIKHLFGKYYRSTESITQGTGMKGEHDALHAGRVYPRLFKFTKFFHNKTYSALRLVENLADANTKAGKALLKGIKKGNWKEATQELNEAIVADFVDMPRFVAANMAAGIIGQFVSSLRYGLDGPAQVLRDAQEDPLGWAVENGLKYMFLGATAGMMYDLATNPGPESERQVLDALRPLSALKDIGDFGAATLEGATGSRMLNFTDKSQKKDPKALGADLLSRNIAMSGMIGNIASSLGLWNKDPGMNNAMRALYAFRKRHDMGHFGGSPGTLNDDQSNWTRAFNNVKAELRKAEPDYDMISGQLARALGVYGKDRSKVAQALRARRVITGNALNEFKNHRNPKLLGMLYKNLGQKNVAKLLAYDKMLERLADLID